MHLFGVFVNHGDRKSNGVTIVSSEVLSIRQTQQLGGKDLLKNWLGRSLTMVQRRRAIELYRKPENVPQSIIDKAIMFHLRCRALDENRQGFFERLHREFWSGQGGAVFSENSDHRFKEIFLERQREEFEALESVWNEQQPDRIIEIGTNSGLLLNFLTNNLHGVKSATGIDVNADQIRRNQDSNDFDPRISFEHADGNRWIVDNAKSNTLFVTNGGVLEYFRRERLDEMVTHLSNHCRPAVFFVSEPVADDHDFRTTRDSIPFGDELSFSHNYGDLFASNGFHVVHQRPVVFDTWKMMATIAVTDPIDNFERDNRFK